jgi:glycogen debranching enzyme
VADLIVLDGSTFFVSEESGDVDATHHEGFFVEDVRHLSRWQLLVDGKPIELLTGRRVDYFSARMVGSVGGETPVSVRRDRFVSEGFHEDVVLENLSDEPQDVRVEVCFGSDFADVMDAQSKGEDREGVGRSETGKRTVELSKERDGYRRSTVITFTRQGRLSADRMRFDVRLPARGQWKTCVDVAPVVDGKRMTTMGCDSFGEDEPKMHMSVEEWFEAAPEIDTDSDPIVHTYRQSLADLAALRLRPSDSYAWALPAGGVPWFMTVFGRDSMVASYEALPFQPHLAETTLRALAEFQATEFDHFADSEPGKIIHELRRGTMAATGKIPKRYYGAHDTTALYLILLDEYERWTGDKELVRRLEDAARAALAWIEGPGDPDGDGYLEYRRRSSSPTALDNHCWKDSDESIVFADGRKAEPPIATCETQGYAYDARLRAGRLAREVWNDAELAKRLEHDAAELKERFNRDFWHSRRRHYVLALDGEKRQVDSLASNIGHLLWSGIVDEDRAEATVRALLRDDLFNGWGIRSLSARMSGFNPLEYHNGTVWPHDTAICAEGVRRYGFREEASRVACALLDAAAAFGHQLPELFSGFERDATNVPVPYPNALMPQAWAAGAPLLALRTLLGLDAERGHLRADPHLPASLGRLRLRGVRVHRRRVDV